jgi:two-component system, LytTR family, response regulator
MTPWRADGRRVDRDPTETPSVTLRVVLIDDEPLALSRLAAGFARIDGVEVVGTAADGVSAAQAVARLAPDLVMLDIQMPGMNGLALARALDAAPRPDIVFVTAFDHYAPEAFAVEAVDFLLKPVQFDRLTEAVERARRRRDLRRQAGRAAELESVVEALTTEADRYDTEIWVPGREGLVRVQVDQIEWIEAARDYVLLHTPMRSHILRATMAAIGARLDPAQMLRAHRSAFVRLSAVREVRRPSPGRISLVLTTGAEVQVGSIYARAVQTALGI